MQIAQITQKDLAQINELRPDGWPDLIPHYQFYIESSFSNPIKISIDGQIAGIGASIQHKSTAWLGHIIVHKDYRNRGIGTKITKVLCEMLHPERFHSVSLIATELGEPVYRKLGFEKETEYHFFKNEGMHDYNSETENIHDFDVDYAGEILSMDKLITGEDRILLLQNHLPAAKVFLSRNKVIGFYLPTLHEGLIISTDKLAGIELLKLRLKHKAVSILPKENTGAIEFLSTHQFKYFQKGSRMSLGRRTGLKAEMLFNRIGGNLG